MEHISDRLSHMFSSERISRYLVESLLPDLVVSVLVFSFFYLLHRVVARIARATLERTPLDLTARQFVQMLLKYFILTIGVISTLSQVGVDTGGLLTSLGVAGLTIGFAARDTISNIISGLFIFWDRPFVVGDLVEVGGNYGRVTEITMRSTRVVTVDGKMLAVPNSTIVNTTVASYTNFPHLRLDVSVTVGVGEDLTRVRELLLAIVDRDDRYMAEPAPIVGVVALNDYNVEVQLRAWIADERSHIPLRLELREKMFETLRGAGVELPYETLQLAPVQIQQVAAAT